MSGEGLGAAGTPAIDRELWSRLRIQAIREGKPAYHILNELISRYLEKQEGRA